MGGSRVADCCGERCRYAEGVARADHLLGPWEKFPGNPLVAANSTWRCPGHGTAVHGPKGKDYLLYHAYPVGGTIYIGREAVLDQIKWSADGWPVINDGMGPGKPGPTPSIDFADNFTAHQLDASWQWPVNTRPHVETGGGVLALRVPHHKQSALVAVSAPPHPRYSATVSLHLESLRGNQAAWAGLVLIGDPFNTVGLGVRNGDLQLWRRAGAQAEVLWQHALSSTDTTIDLQIFAHDEALLQFSFRVADVAWVDAGPSVDATNLPAWDRGLRLGFLIEGPGGTLAHWSSFHLGTT